MESAPIGQAACDADYNRIDVKDDKEKEFVLFILDTYEKAGEKELSMENLTRLLELKYHTTNEGMSILGEAQEIVKDYLELQKEIYEVEIH